MHYFKLVVVGLIPAQKMIVFLGSYSYRRIARKAEGTSSYDTTCAQRRNGPISETLRLEGRTQYIGNWLFPRVRVNVYKNRF